MRQFSAIIAVLIVTLAALSSCGKKDDKSGDQTNVNQQMKNSLDDSENSSNTELSQQNKEALLKNTVSDIFNKEDKDLSMMKQYIEEGYYISLEKGNVDLLLDHFFYSEYGEDKKYEVTDINPETGLVKCRLSWKEGDREESMNMDINFEFIEDQWRITNVAVAPVSEKIDKLPAYAKSNEGVKSTLSDFFKANDEVKKSYFSPQFYTNISSRTGDAGALYFIRATSDFDSEVDQKTAVFTLTETNADEGTAVYQEKVKVRFIDDESKLENENGDPVTPWVLETHTFAVKLSYVDGRWLIDNVEQTGLDSPIRKW